MQNISLYNNDCFNVFPEIEDKTIDLFVLDLPYGQTACSWDICIDLDKMWVEIKRIMKPSAIICFFCTTKFGYSLIKSNEKWFKYDLIYKKGNKSVGFLHCNKRELRNHENIYVFKDKQGTYNPQKLEGKEYNKYRPTQNITTIDGAYGKIFKANTEEKVNDRFPTSIITDTILNFKPPHNPIHRTEKPIGLLEYLIKTYSNKGDVVMDFTAGSLTCGIACLNTNRKFIGVEMNKEIFELGLNRIVEYEKNINKNIIKN